MKTIITAASILMLSGAAAFAQTTPSTTDGGANPAGQTAPDKSKDHGKMAPKTTGAMDNAASGVATSPQDVQKQSSGGKTGEEAQKHSPGTVGATPGAEPPK
jgi:hypothetical protein